MPLRRSLSAPHRLVVIFVVVTLVPSVLLVAFGWRMVQQEQVIEQGRLEARRDQTADLAIAALERSVSDAERLLRDPVAGGVSLPEGAVVVSFERDRVVAVPQGRVSYYPISAPLAHAPSDRFEALDAAEYQANDRATARKLAGELAGSPDPAVRATALIRLARTLRASGDPERSLQLFHEAAQVQGVGVEGIPVDLFARWARCTVLEELRRDEDLRTEARALQADLLAGRWTLTRPIYELHLTDSARWGKTPASHSPDRVVLTAAVDLLYTRLQSGSLGQPRPARQVVDVQGTPVTVLTMGDAKRAIAFLASQMFVEQHWVGPLHRLLEPQALRASLIQRATRAPPAVVRGPSDTGLPWAVTIEPLGNAARDSGMVRRMYLWVSGLFLLAMLTLTATWAVARAVTRELAVARLQSDFVSAVSHEFRTPLTTMSQLTEMLIEGRMIDGDRRTSYYEALGRQTERLRRLVESLLDFGRMEAGRAPYRREPIDASCWIQAVVHQFQRDPASGRHHIHLRLGDTRSLIMGDREALTNAFWNLLDNAVKYSPDAADVWVEVTCSKGRLVIDVRDAGVGIPSAEQKQIFGKFVRGARAKAERIKGTGIGLAMVRHVVHGHGGEIHLESTEGQGSTFTLLLPLKRGPFAGGSNIESPEVASDRSGDKGGRCLAS
jgi:signal transduction histidine kinase